MHATWCQGTESLGLLRLIFYHIHEFQLHEQYILSEYYKRRAPTGMILLVLVEFKNVQLLLKNPVRSRVSKVFFQILDFVKFLRPHVHVLFFTQSRSLQYYNLKRKRYRGNSANYIWELWWPLSMCSLKARKSLRINDYTRYKSESILKSGWDYDRKV